MARTDAGAELTLQHRRRQIAVRAATLRELVELWPTWSVSEPGSFDRFTVAATAVTSVGHRTSATVAGAYYEAFRFAEGVDGTPSLWMAEPLDRARVGVALRASGLQGTVRALRAGHTMDRARQLGFVAMSGEVTRHVLNGGRDTITGSVRRDRQATGWQRKTSGDPCHFCMMIASQGAVYKSQASSSFQAHLHCVCTPEALYPGSQPLPENEQYREAWDQAQAEAAEAGELHRGTSNDALNAFRRFLGT
jgi:hypothetical protein